MKTIKISVKGKEQDLMEALLNSWYSDGNKNLIQFSLFMFAVSKRWKLDKLSYYKSLFEEMKE